LSSVEKELLKETGREEKSGTLGIDEVFLTRQITDINSKSLALLSNWYKSSKNAFKKI